MTNGKPNALFAPLVVALALIAAPASAQWQWTITPYGWLTDIGLDATINDRDVPGGDVEGDELLSNIDFVLQVHAEGQNGRHGLLLDLTYLNLGGDPEVRDLPGNLTGTVELEADLSATLLEVGGIYNPRGDGSGFAVLYGTRIVDLGEDIEADFSSPIFADRTYSIGGTLVDGMLGARWVGKVSERWTLLLRGDVSAGGTEMTLNGLGAIGYSFGTSGRYTALAGYRYLEIELKEDDTRAEIETQATLSGAFIALAIRL